MRNIGGSNAFDPEASRLLMVKIQSLIGVFMLRALAVITLLVIVERPVLAQTSVRPSLAGDFSNSQRKPVMDSSNYNLLMGPVSVKLSASLNLDYNDNITYADHNRQGDLLIEPQIDANVLWQVSAVNSLRLDLGFGYEAYASHSQYNSNVLTVAPNSQLAFDIYVGDFKFTIYDQISVQQNPTSEINVSQVAQFGRIENSAGISGLWDGNQLTILGGYSHYNFIALQSQFDYATHSEEQFYLSAGLKINDALTVGVRSTFGLIDYDKNFNSSGDDYSAGPYVEAQLTKYLWVSAEGGYQGGHFDGNGLNGDTSQLSSFYARLQLRHKLNAYWTETLDVGHEAQLGLVTNTTSVTYVRYSANWRVNSRLSLTLSGFYEHGKDSTAPLVSEKVDLYGGSVMFGYDLGRKVHLTGGYRFTDRNSDLPNRDYYSNEILMGVSYDF
jgi:hypothetical protein